MSLVCDFDGAVIVVRQNDNDGCWSRDSYDKRERDRAFVTFEPEQNKLVE